MPTSDGIKDRDWDRVKELACDMVNMSAMDHDTTNERKRIITYLESLVGKYGRLPSIISTMSEYINNTTEELQLLKESYCTACEIDDAFSKAIISSSLTEYYIDNDLSVDLQSYWYNLFEENRQHFSDEYFDSISAEFEEHISGKTKQ